MEELLEILKNSIVGQLNTIFEWCGRASCNVLVASIKMYNMLVTSATEILSWKEAEGVLAPIKDSVSIVTKIIAAVSTLIMAILFLSALAGDVWAEQKQIDPWCVIKDFVKLAIAIVIVNFADKIVYGIFSFGGLLAQAVTLKSGGFKGVYINSEIKDSILYGTPGLRGLIMFILFLFVALIIIACAVIITVEIYQRLFKIYILIPFSTVSFSTFVMGHMKGREIFEGYLKNLIALSIEAVIIMLAINFSIIFINSEIIDNALAKFITEKDAVTVDCNSGYDVLALDYAIHGDVKSYTSIVVFAEAKKKPLSDDTINFIKNNVVKGDDDGWAYLTVDGEYYKADIVDLSVVGIASKIFNGKIWDFFKKDDTKPKNVVVHPALSWMKMFAVVLKIVFPIILCTATVKEANRLSNMVLGR